MSDPRAPSQPRRVNEDSNAQDWHERSRIMEELFADDTDNDDPDPLVAFLRSVGAACYGLANALDQEKRST